MKSTAIAALIGLFFSVNVSAQYAELAPEVAAAMNQEAGRNIARYNPAHAHGDSLGIFGMDPVSFYKDAPTQGSEEFQTVHQGVTYLFSTAAHQWEFLANPNKYEPTYGGWCARAMAAGSPVPIDTNYYSFDFDENGQKSRINFFVSEGALKTYHGLRRRDTRGSAEIAADMQAGDTALIEAAKSFQDQADAFWASPEHGNEAPRFSNGQN